MIVYCSTFFLSITIMFFCKRFMQYEERSLYRNALVFAAMIPLLIVSSIRQGIGTDYDSYIEDFYQANAVTVKQTNQEIGFYYLSRALHVFTDNAQIVIAFCALIFIFFTALQIAKDSEIPELSILLLFGTTYYFMSFNAIQQTTGCAILLFSLRYVEQRDIKKFAICILAASAFHYSCFLFAITYFFPKLQALSYKLVMGVVIIFIAFNNVMTKLFLAIIERTPYAGYLTSEYFTNGSAGMINLLIQFAILLLGTIYYRNDLKYKCYYLLQAAGTCIASLGQIPYIARRIQTIFLFPVIILIPMILNNIKDKRLRLVALTGVTLCYFVYGYYLTATGNHEVVPYETIFSEIQ